MRFLVNDMLRRALVKVCMRFELEQQVKHVYDQQNHTGATANLKSLVVRCAVARKRRMEGRLIVHQFVFPSQKNQLSWLIGSLTGKRRLMTAKLSKQALICVTVLL